MTHMPLTIAGNIFHSAYVYAGCARAPSEEHSALFEFFGYNGGDLCTVVFIMSLAEDYMRQSGMIN